MNADVEFVAFLDESVRATAGAIVLLQHQHAFARQRHEGGGGESAHAGADHDGVQIGRN